MNVQTVWAVWWSATGNTRTVVEAVSHELAEQLGDLSPEDILTTIATIHRFYQVVRSCKTEESKT